MRSLILLVPLGLLGCSQPSVMELAQALNERQVAHCLFVQAAVAPYGTAYLYAQVGDLDCVSLWKERNRAALP